MIRSVLAGATAQLSAFSDSPRLDAELLLGHLLGYGRAQLLTHDDESLSESVLSLYKSLLDRRCLGEPVAYLLGYRDFWKHRFVVGPGVLVPRPETELLVEHALRWLDGLQEPRILDLGTGSGAIGLSIALALPQAQVTLTDRSLASVEIARRNHDALGATAEILEGSWFEPVGGRNFDLIVSNPPYVAPDDPHLQGLELQHEPRTALVAAEDGFADLKQIIGGATAHLLKGGRILLEHGHTQASGVRDLLGLHGFGSIQSFCDLSGIERATGGVLGD